MVRFSSTSAASTRSYRVPTCKQLLWTLGAVGIVVRTPLDPGLWCTIQKLRTLENKICHLTVTLAGPSKYTFCAGSADGRPF
jgi:hypothetical protein